MDYSPRHPDDGGRHADAGPRRKRGPGRRVNRRQLSARRTGAGLT